MTTSPLLTFNNGVKMPALGFGVLFSCGDETVGMARKAIETGYRLIDTAAAYRNEDQNCIKNSYPDI